MEQTSKHNRRIDEAIEAQDAPFLKGPAVESRVNDQYKEQDLPPNGTIEDVERFNNGEDLDPLPNVHQ